MSTLTMTPRVATLVTTLPKPYLRLAVRSYPYAATTGLRYSSTTTTTTTKRSNQSNEAFAAPKSDLIREVDASHPV